MKISSKGRYAVRIMAELAKSHDYVSVNEMSVKQGISVKYLEQIFHLLSRANFVLSARGALGGYKIAVDPKTCSVAQILKVTNDLPELAPCFAKGNSCPRANCCDSVDCWSKLTNLIDGYLESVKISDIISKK